MLPAAAIGDRIAGNEAGNVNQNGGHARDFLFVRFYSLNPWPRLRLHDAVAFMKRAKSLVPLTAHLPFIANHQQDGEYWQYGKGKYCCTVNALLSIPLGMRYRSTLQSNICPWHPFAFAVRHPKHRCREG